MGRNLNTSTNDVIYFNPSEMIATTRKLSKLLTTEIALLKDMKIAKIHELYEDKIELTAILESYKEILSNNPGVLNAISKRTLDEMRTEAARFEALIEEDRKLIFRANEVHKLIMDALRKSLEKNVVMSSGYNNKGVISSGYGMSTYIAPPVSVNKNI